MTTAPLNRAMLIRLSEGKIVHANEIRRAERCGNYTHVWYHGDALLDQIWDEDMKVWNAINDCSR